MKIALEKYGKVTQAAMKKGQTMKNTTGRDDSMYYVSDNSNLKQQEDNQFDAIMALYSIK